VRVYVGYQRLDTVAQTILLNQLNDCMWVYYNFFQPVMRLCEKIRLPTDGKFLRFRRRFDRAQTPLDRLCASGILTHEIQHALLNLRDDTNPRQLRQEIYTLLDQLLSFPCASIDHPEDVYSMIGLWKSGKKTAAHFSTISTTETAVVSTQL
jgi:hypothetical protein